MEVLALCHVGSDQIRNATCLDKNNTCQDKTLNFGENVTCFGTETDENP